jgi:ABC-type transport system involved in multi-copper enzyme maturation permease subunit
MRAVFAIATDWVRLVRDQKSFRILAWIMAAFGLLLAVMRVEPRSINILFMWDIPLSAREGNEVLYVILSFYLDTLPFIAYLVAIFATSGVVPDLLRKGRIDTILARPVTRAQFVLGSYLGGLVFVVCLAAILSLSSWIGLAARGRVFPPVWFLTVPIVALQYAILSSLLLFFGVALRSGAGSAVLTILFWLFGSVMASFHSMRSAIEAGEMPPETESLKGFLSGTAGPVIDVLYWILPKGKELDRLFEDVFDAVIEEGLPRAIAKRHGAEAILDTVNWWTVCGTSAGLIVVMLALATWILKRRDL